MVRRKAQAHVAVHPLESPAAEAFFKGLLWAMLILMTLVFARQFNREMVRASQHSAQAREARA